MEASRGTLATGSIGREASPVRARARRRWAARVPGEAWVLAAAVLAFLLLAALWLVRDRQVQASDDALHTLLAFAIHDQLARGDLTSWFTEFNTYPPLAHLVGAIVAFFTGRSPMGMILGVDLVFVPLLAASCFGVGRIAHGPRAGLFAGLFALATPMVVSQTHMFMVDVPEAAMVAAAVWALLASQRFERVGPAALGGLLTGLALMTKSTSVIFIAGPFLVTLLRGGWRRPWGLLAFLLPAAVISLPWYIHHLSQLNGLVEGQSGLAAAPSAEAAPPVLSKASLFWYFWAALNIQLLAPLVLFLVIGVVLAVAEWIRGLPPKSIAPELLAGLFVSWLGITLIGHKDARFTLPALVYVAVLATGWIAAARRPVRLAAGGVLAVVLLADLLGITFGIGNVVRVTLPGAPAQSGIGARRVTLYSSQGYVRGGPVREADVLAMMRGLRHEGIQSVSFDAGSTAGNVVDFSAYGLEVRANQAGIAVPAAYDPGALGPRDAFMLLHVPEAGDPPPCGWLSGGLGVYIELGNAVAPFETYTLICPGRHPAVYRRTAPLSLATQIQLHPEIEGATRTMLLGVLLGLHRLGVQAITYDRESADAVFFQPVGLERLAAAAQLPVAAGVAPQQLTPTQAYLSRRPAGSPGPAPCGRFPDGSGLYVVLGDPAVAHPHYVCP